MSEIKREEKDEKKEETKEETKEEIKEEIKEEECICYSQAQLISKPNEVQFEEPVHAQRFMPQHIAELVIQEPLFDATRAATGAVIYDGLIHKNDEWCSIS
jgi:hypothetical protein